MTTRPPAEIGMSLDEVDTPGWTGATRAVDEIRDRFGDAAIVPATLAGLRPKRRGDTQCGPG